MCIYIYIYCFFFLCGQELVFCLLFRQCFAFSGGKVHVSTQKARPVLVVLFTFFFCFTSNFPKSLLFVPFKQAKLKAEKRRRNLNEASATYTVFFLHGTLSQVAKQRRENIVPKVGTVLLFSRRQKTKKT